MSSPKPLTIAVDFDGTIVEHAYPEIGPLVPGALDVLHECIDRGAKLILFTVRDGHELDDATEFLFKNGVRLHGINRNKDVRTRSPKPYYDVLVDDRALGCPLMPGYAVRNRPCVDWEKVRPILLKHIDLRGC